MRKEDVGWMERWVTVCFPFQTDRSVMDGWTSQAEESSGQKREKGRLWVGLGVERKRRLESEEEEKC